MQEFEKKSTKIDIREQLSEAFEIFKKIAMPGSLALLCLCLVFFILFSVGMGFFFKAEEIPKILKNFNPETLSLNGQMIYVGVIVIISGLVSPFMAGLIKMARDADNNEQVQFSSIFTYVNSPQFLDIVFATISITLLSSGSNILLNHFIINPYAAVLSNLIVILIAVLTILVVPHIIFGQLHFIKAIKTSVNQILANFFSVIFLLSIPFILGMIGLFLFIIGALFIMPFLYAMYYCIYKKLNS